MIVLVGGEDTLAKSAAFFSVCGSFLFPFVFEFLLSLVVRFLFFFEVLQFFFRVTAGACLSPR